MKTVAAISFHDNHSISMDVDRVREIAVGKPLQLDESQWFCELIIHTDNGKLALQLLAEDPARFKIDAEAEDDLNTDAMVADPPSEID